MPTMLKACEESDSEPGVTSEGLGIAASLWAAELRTPASPSGAEGGQAACLPRMLIDEEDSLLVSLL